MELRRGSGWGQAGVKKTRTLSTRQDIKDMMNKLLDEHQQIAFIKQSVKNYCKQANCTDWIPRETQFNNFFAGERRRRYGHLPAQHGTTLNAEHVQNFKVFIQKCFSENTDFEFKFLPVEDDSSFILVQKHNPTLELAKYYETQTAFYDDTFRDRARVPLTLLAPRKLPPETPHF